MGTKQQVLKAIEELPDDASVEGAMERLYVLYKVERGISRAENGELITQEEARKRMAKCIQYDVYVRQKIQNGLEAVRKGRVLSQAEAEGRMSRWLPERI